MTIYLSRFTPKTPKPSDRVSRTPFLFAGSPPDPLTSSVACVYSFPYLHPRLSRGPCPQSMRSPIHALLESRGSILLGSISDMSRTCWHWLLSLRLLRTKSRRFLGPFYIPHVCSILLSSRCAARLERVRVVRCLDDYTILLLSAD